MEERYAGKPHLHAGRKLRYKLERLKELPRPRPGHGDLSGSIKYLSSIRGILERASARETCVRVAAGALAAQLLGQFGIRALGYVTELGKISISPKSNDFDECLRQRNQSELYTLDSDQDEDLKSYIDQTQKDGDTLGGIVEVRVEGLPFGLGTHAQWDRKLDGKIAQAVMAVQAIKGVEIGLGFESARRTGSMSTIRSNTMKLKRQNGHWATSVLQQSGG